MAERPLFVIAGGTTAMQHIDFLTKMASHLARKSGASYVDASNWANPPIGVEARAQALGDGIEANKGDTDLTVIIAMSAGGPLALHLRERVMSPADQDRTRLALVCSRLTPDFPTEENDGAFGRSSDYKALVEGSPEIVRGLSAASKGRIITFASTGDLIAPPNTVEIPGVLAREVLDSDPPTPHQAAMGMFFRYRALLDKLVKSP